MKRSFLILFLSISFGIINAQITLNYSTHAFRQGDTHIMREASFISEGKSGPNQVWDFSELKCANTKTSEVRNNITSFAQFPNSNFEVVESESSQFYNITENELQFTGIMTSDAVIKYDVPIVKMKYPFTYGNSFNGIFTGSGVSQGSSPLHVKGDYNVVADSYGTLILPNNVIKNVLRVKSVTNTTEMMMCANFDIETTKYIWYSTDQRYPLLMITIVVEKSANNPDKIKQYVYYNENIANGNVSNSVISVYDNIENEINVYPNPFKTAINIDYKLYKDEKISVELYNYAGEKIATIVDNQSQASGNHSTSFDTKSKSLSSGIYFIKFIFDNKTYLKKIIKTDN